MRETRQEICTVGRADKKVRDSRKVEDEDRRRRDRQGQPEAGRIEKLIIFKGVYVCAEVFEGYSSHPFNTGQPLSDRMTSQGSFIWQAVMT